MLPNHPDFLLAWTAAATMGAVAVRLNPGSSVDELRFAGEHSGAAAAVVSAIRADDVAAAMPGLGFLAVSGGGRRGADAVAAFLTTEPEAPGGILPGRAAASVQYTSGTTARPKGVVWTQANCLWAAQAGAAHQGLGPADVNLVHLPLFHTNALSYSFLSSLWSGGQVVLVPKFSASRFWDVSVRHAPPGRRWFPSACARSPTGRCRPGHRYRGWGGERPAWTLRRSPGGVPVARLVRHDRDRVAPGRRRAPAPRRRRDDGPTGARVRGGGASTTTAAPSSPARSATLHVRGRRGVSLFPGVPATTPRRRHGLHRARLIRHR